MMKELHDAESRESKLIGQLLDSIEKQEKEVRKYQENLTNIKQHASDLQTFLTMKQMERDVAEKEKYFTSLVTSNTLNRVSLSCKINDVLQNSFNEIRKFGEIIVSTHSSNVAIVRKKRTQAQTVVMHVRDMSIDNLSFVLQSTVDTKLDCIAGCTLLPDGRMVFSGFIQNRVRAFNRDGSKDFDIRPPTYSYDIAYIHHNNYIAVSAGAYKCINIIDIERKRVKETIPVEFEIYGIVSRNNTLICSAYDHSLQMINLTDKSVNSIGTSKMPCFAYVDTFGDKLYYTNNDTDTVTCCDLHGTIQWEFKDTSDTMKDLRGISVDNAGNVYVAGYWSHNVVVISPDGQQLRKILCDKDGLAFPQALHYDRSANELLVANREGRAFFYKLE